MISRRIKTARPSGKMAGSTGLSLRFINRPFGHDNEVIERFAPASDALSDQAFDYGVTERISSCTSKDEAASVGVEINGFVLTFAAGAELPSRHPPNELRQRGHRMDLLSETPRQRLYAVLTDIILPSASLPMTSMIS